jgi:hypothetical protein
MTQPYERTTALPSDDRLIFWTPRPLFPAERPAGTFRPHQIDLESTERSDRDLPSWLKLLETVMFEPAAAKDR